MQTLGSSGMTPFELMVTGQLEQLRQAILEGNSLMATSKEQVQELVARVANIGDTVTKVYSEVTADTEAQKAHIAELEQKIADGTVTAEDLQPLKDKIDSVANGVKQLDDLNTDVPVVDTSTDETSAEAPADELPQGGPAPTPADEAAAE